MLNSLSAPDCLQHFEFVSREEAKRIRETEFSRKTRFRGKYMRDQYNTVVGLAESKLEAKKSRFIGVATAVLSQGAIKEFLKLEAQTQ